MHYVYFLQSQKTNKFYIGRTSRKPNERLKEHNAGLSRYTNQHRPYNLVYYESYVCEDDAKHRELFYKSGIGKQVRKIILEYFLDKQLTIKISETKA